MKIVLPLLFYCILYSLLHKLNFCIMKNYLYKWRVLYPLIFIKSEWMHENECHGFCCVLPLFSLTVTYRDDVSNILHLPPFAVTWIFSSIYNIVHPKYVRYCMNKQQLRNLVLQWVLQRILVRRYSLGPCCPSRRLDAGRYPLGPCCPSRRFAVGRYPLGPCSLSRRLAVGSYLLGPCCPSRRHALSCC